MSNEDEDYGGDYDDQNYFGEEGEYCGYEDDGMDYEDEEQEEEEEMLKKQLNDGCLLALENGLFKSKTTQKILEGYKEQIRQISTNNGISQGRAFLILSHSNYDPAVTDSVPYDIIDDIFYTEKKELDAQKNQKECLLCFEELTDSTKKYALDCEHYFCNDCFSQYMDASLKCGPEFLRKTCPQEGCRERIGLNEVEKFFKLQQKKDLVDKFILNDALVKRKAVLQCPFANCDELFECVTSDPKVISKQFGIRCTQGEGYFCNLCSEDAHMPCTCEMLDKWLHLIRGQSNSDVSDIWMKLNTKPCPKCKTAIEKNNGCMHMNCTNCNFHFCWLCLTEYVNHEDYYSCNKYSPEADKDLSNEEVFFKKYTFYSDRFNDHMSNVKPTVVDAKNYYNTMHEKMFSAGIKESEYEFYSHAFMVLIEAKKGVAYSYPIGYYIDEDKRDLFEFMQGELERNLNPLEVLLTRKAKFDRFIVSGELSERFFKFKDAVSDKSEKMRTYLKSMLTDMHNELPDCKKMDSINASIYPQESSVLNCLGLKKVPSSKLPLRKQASTRRPAGQNPPNRRSSGRGQAPQLRQQQSQANQEISFCESCMIQPKEVDSILCRNCQNL